jgi:hypothetical protein
MEEDGEARRLMLTSHLLDLGQTLPRRVDAATHAPPPSRAEKVSHLGGRVARAEGVGGGGQVPVPLGRRSE